MADLNNGVFSGTVEGVPEVSTDEKGIVLKFVLAVRRPPSADGNQVVEKITVVAIGKTAEEVSDMLEEGMSLILVGRLRKTKEEGFFIIAQQILLVGEILRDYDLNMVSTVGVLTKDPEIRYTSNGKAVAHITKAVNRAVRGQADFLDIIAWENKAETISNHMTKGKALGCQGRLQSRSYNRQSDNEEVIIYEIQMSEMYFIRGGSSGNSNGGSAGNSNSGFGDLGENIPDHEIPF